jgi:hypothetical protein
MSVKSDQPAPQRYPRILGVSLTLLSLLRIFNLVSGVILICGFVLSFLFEPQSVHFLTKGRIAARPEVLLPTLRIWMLLAAPMVIAIHVLLSRLLGIIETVRRGDPFVAENAGRLKVIARCLLAVQLLQLAYGLIVQIMDHAGARIDWTFSITGWMAVVLLFVLARIFEEGTQIRDDLGAMI